ncbi:MAG: hypothetical protein QOG32_1384 [Chloroflexota bacterium]|nr:hypothetical protein [Chloroflexota bacterium]
MNRVVSLVSNPFAPIALVVLVVAALFTFRFFPSQPHVIDGYQVGEQASCGDRCPMYAATGARWLDQFAPGHPTITSTAIYVPDLRGVDGGQIPVLSGGSVVAMTLADGTVRAVFVSCGATAASCTAGPPPQAPTGQRDRATPI